MSDPPIVAEPVRGGYPDIGLFGLDGLASLRASFRGHGPAPPMSRLTGLTPGEVGSGHASFSMPAGPWLVGSTGTIPGGALALMADAALGCALQTELGPATPYTTSELSLTSLRPVRAGGGILTAGANLIHHGAAVGLAEAFVIEEGSDRIVAHLTSRLAIFPPISPPPVVPDPLPLAPEPQRLDDDPWRRTPVRGEVIAEETWERLSGLEVLRAQIAEEQPLPPISHLIGIVPVAAEEGTAEFSMPATEWHNSPARRMQGGFIALLAESALLGAVQSTAAAGTAVAPLDFKVNYLSPVTADDGELRAEGRVDHSGRTIAIAGAEIFNSEGKRVAIATGSSMYLPGHPASLGEIELGASNPPSGLK